MTSDHLFPVLESEATSELFTHLASLPAVGQAPDVILEAITLGRLTALQKPDGGVRIVVGGIVRRLVARTMTKHFSKRVEAATAPVRVEDQSRMRVRRSRLADPDSRRDSHVGVGAYDLISRNATLEGLLRMEEGDVRCSFGSPSTCLWEDEMKITQSIPQAEGGEQGDPLVPMLFAF